MSKTINRRKFFTKSALSAAGIMLGSNLVGSTYKKETAGISLGSNLTGYPSQKDSSISSYDLMKDIMKYRKFDGHTHPMSDLGEQIDMADRLGIEWMQISRPKNSSADQFTPEEVRRNNDVVLAAIKQYPKRFIGCFTLNPVYQKESLEELKRCVDQGMVGYKGYVQVKVNDPLYYPILEKLIDLKMICFMHAELQLGFGGYRMKYDVKERPNVTIPEDMVAAAKRYPEAMFQWAHISSGDWEYIAKIFKDYPNIYVDISGSNNEENYVDFCLRYLGEDRIFFGSDGSYYQSIGKILTSHATEAQRKKIFFDNYNNILKKGGHNVA